MMYRALALGALAAPLAFAAPTQVAKRQDIDTTVLQFALTLEHLENVFYKQALQKFSASDFAAAGFGANYYNNLRYISSDEESHTKFLTAALTAANQKPVAACTYSFPYTDVKSFITLSTVLEGVGTSAYLGGAPLITNKAYLTAAGAILVSEALHTSLQRNAIGAIPNANPYGTPLEPNSVYTLAASFIKSCPDSNAALPFKPYPALTYDGTATLAEQPNAGAPVSKREAEADADNEPCPEEDNKGWKGYGTSTKAAQPTYQPQPTTKAPQPTYQPQPTTKAPQPTYQPQPTKSSSPQPTYAPSVPQAPLAGTPVTFTGASAIPAGSFLTFVSGLTVSSVAGSISGSKITANIPSGIAGQSYVFVTKSAASGNTLDTASILFGPSILEVKPAPPSIDFNYSK